MQIKSLFIIASFLTLSFGQINAADNAKNKSASNWELIEETNGIQMLERWVTTDTDLKVKERTGKMVLNCSALEVLNLIASTDKTKQWMNNAESVKRLKTINQNDWYVHTILEAPWPFNKQDMVSRYQVKTENDVILIVINKEDKIFPPQKDIDRLDTFNAEWIIEPIREGKTKVTFTTISTQPPKYPSWAQDPVVRKVFIGNMKNFKNILNKES